LEHTDVSDMRTASIIRAMMTPRRLNGDISQKALIFILAAVRKLNLTTEGKKD
jgi:hypothetical protein